MCGNCGKKLVDRLGLHALTKCSSCWGRVGGHDVAVKVGEKKGMEGGGLG